MARADSSTNKWLRKDTVRESSVYKELMIAAEKRLKKEGYFAKQDVLEDTNMVTVGGGVRWDYLFEFLEEAYDIKLLKVASRFFKTYDKDASGKRIRTDVDRRENPGKYLAMGHGKKTAGYVLAEIDDGGLAIKVLTLKNSRARGTRAAATKFQRELTKRKVIGGPDQKRIAKG